MLRFSILWFIVILLFAISFTYLILLLRRKPPQRTTRNWIGVLSMNLVSLAALIGMLFIQLHEIDPIKSDSWLLFLAAMYGEQVIAHWTQNDERPFGPLSPRWYQAYTIFMVIFALFALVAVVFRL